jgi:hypothetical protein
MALSAAASSLAARRGAVIALFVAIATALGIAVFRPGMFSGEPSAGGTEVGQQVGKGISSLKNLGDTVAGMFGSRSPGERAAGVLANLKQRRHAPLHQRALPKIRRPANPLGAIVSAPPAPPVVPAPSTPLFNVVNAAPTPPVPVAAVAPPGAPPVIFPGFIPPGGGGVIIPPPQTPPDTPPVTPPVIPPVIPPTTPGIPEPATWAMMLIGFAMIGGGVRRRRAVLAIAAR